MHFSLQWTLPTPFPALKVEVQKTASCAISVKLLNFSVLQLRDWRIGMATSKEGACIEHLEQGPAHTEPSTDISTRHYHSSHQAIVFVFHQH